MKYINLEYLKTTCGGSLEMVGQIVDMFLKSSPESIELIQNSLNSQDWNELKRQAHKAKSSFLMMGAKLTGEKLAQVEIGSANPDVEILTALVQEIVEESAIIYDELREALIAAKAA